ncbi:hypothetical protein E5288_WYG013315 [Bos mutus]|uniref:Ras-associating domain-containing protein n=1 Tax=Bos mutus TaxID=72004 RepID=A0A6B0S6W8_9CETA|nr:hypothetical protein [Bos mutus]
MGSSALGTFPVGAGDCGPPEQAQRRTESCPVSHRCLHSCASLERVSLPLCGRACRTAAAFLKEPPVQDGRVTAQEPSSQAGPQEESSRDRSEPVEEDEETPQLLRTKSDAACVIQRRPRSRAPGEAQRTRRHRFSINGHFYNHKTSVFTPAYGSMTNVRVNSTMTTLQVLTLLLNKFRVENGPSEFALYVVHESGERTKLKDCEYPLIARILHGPCEKIARIFLMEADLGEEVPHDVAQYIKFEMPVLDSFVEKLKEEEEREIIKLTMNAWPRVTAEPPAIILMKHVNHWTLSTLASCRHSETAGKSKNCHREWDVQCSQLSLCRGVPERIAKFGRGANAERSPPLLTLT